MTKQTVLSFIVVADSNALFPKDPTQIVSGRFTATWEECLKFARLRLFLPEVVRGERLYQLLSAALRARENAEKNFETITKISASPTVRLPEIVEIRKAVEKRFDEWATAKSIEIIPVPCDKINWRRVVSDSIWRVSPFTPSSEDKDTEKGFRDCLILETLDDLIRSNSGEQVVFITRDRLLRDSTIARFETKALAAYEDLDGFLSYLKLTHEQAEKARNELIQTILQKAPGVFFAADNPHCAYTKFSIGNRIIQQFSAQLNVLPQPQPENSETAAEGFCPAAGEKIFIDSTQFEQSISKSKMWGWKTRLRFIRPFRLQTPASNAAANVSEASVFEKMSEALALNEIVRIAPFDVYWTAQCDSQANFSQLKLVDVKAQPQTQELGFFKFKYGFQVNGPA